MANTYLTRTVGTATTATKYTLSMWIKRSKLSSEMNLIGISSGTVIELIKFTAANKLEWYNRDSASNVSNAATSNVFRDTSAWMHLVFVYDSTQSGSNPELQKKLYINGVNQTFASNVGLAANAVAGMNLSGAVTKIGAEYSPNYYFDGSISHIHFVDGTAYQASDFGETDSTTGEWKIKTSPSVTYGNNGFFILKDGNSVTDQSGNSNNFTVAGGTLTKTEDSPSNNFATLNNLVGDVAGGYTIINGNLSVTANTGDAWRTMYGTIAASKGKFYFEQKIDNASGTSHYVGASEVENMEQTNTNGFEDTATSAYCYRPDGGKVSKDSLTAGWGASWTAGDIIGTAIDIDNLKIYFSKNGVWQASGDPTSGATGTGAAYTIDAGKTYTAATATYNTQNDYSYNFGNGYFATSAVSSAGTNASGIGIFEYDVPTGYQALCTKGINSF